MNSEGLNGKLEFSDIVQVAGVIDREEADLLVQCGVRFLSNAKSGFRDFGQSN